MSSTTKAYDLVIYRNRDFKMNLYFKDAAGDAVNLAGWTGRSQVRTEMSADSTLLFDFVVTVTDAANGKVVVEASDLVTGVSEEEGAYDVMMTNPSGYDESYVMGNVTFADVPTVKS